MIFALAVIGGVVACGFAFVTCIVCAVFGVPPTQGLLLYGGLACLAAGELVTFGVGLAEL